MPIIKNVNVPLKITLKNIKKKKELDKKDEVYIIYTGKIYVNNKLTSTFNYEMDKTKASIKVVKELIIADILINLKGKYFTN